MAVNNMNDMPSFATVDNVVDSTMYSPNVPMQISNLDSKLVDSIENITIPVPSTAGGSLQPMMTSINNNMSSTMPSVPLQNHIPSNAMSHIATSPMNQVATNSMNQVPTSSMNLVSTNSMNQGPTNSMNNVATNPMNQISTNTMNQISANTMNQIPSNSMNQIPSNTMNQIPTNTMNQIPSNTMNQIPSNTMNQIPTNTMNQMPSNTMNQIPTNIMNQTPTNNMNHVPKQSASSSQSAVINPDQILTKTRLQDLVKEIDPCEQLDEEVEDLLLQLVDDFVNSTVNTACVFAKHRNAGTVEVKDVQLYLEKMYQMWIPGFGTEEVKPYKKPPITEAHKQRLALIRKSLKKY